MTKTLIVIGVLSLALFQADSAHAHWDSNCPIPRDLPPLWQASFSPIIGWRYPCHKVMRSFAPPTCWHTYTVATAFGREVHSEFICR
jgi:hypothetical protein